MRVSRELLPSSFLVFFFLMVYIVYVVYIYKLIKPRKPNKPSYAKEREVANMVKKTIITAEAVNARREYQRKWRQENREHIRAYNAEYWGRKAAEAKEQPTEGLGRG